MKRYNCSRQRNSPLFFPLYCVLWIFFVNNRLSLLHKCAYLVFSFLLLFYLYSILAGCSWIRSLPSFCGASAFGFCCCCCCCECVFSHSVERQWITCEIVFVAMRMGTIYLVCRRKSRAVIDANADAAALYVDQYSRQTTFRILLAATTWFYLAFCYFIYSVVCCVNIYLLSLFHPWHSHIAASHKTDKCTRSITCCSISFSHFFFFFTSL